ncbi:DUF998 domain-containing protein [Streptomyces sp. NPDC101118]|uniref:DUF998 domain-containing protein n=1 Tax=Streptomyces sp. NPDC101118 TaxID=3366109 RepID=UPI00382320F4
MHEHELAARAPRRLAAGGLLWASLIQMLVVNNVFVLPRATNQNLVREIISALGITRCGRIEGFRFCSPWHEAADVAWIVGGACLFLGAVLNAALFPPGRIRNAAFATLAVSGLGLTSTGLNPYNVRPTVHLLSAGTCFFFGAAGVLLLGTLLRRAGRPYWGTLGIVCGVTSLVCAVLTGVRPDPGAQGAVERAAAWPSVLWIIGSGAVIAFSAGRDLRAGRAREPAARSGGRPG